MTYDCAAALRLLQHSPSPNTPDKFWAPNEQSEQKKELWANGSSKKRKMCEKGTIKGEVQGIQPLPEAKTNAVAV
jgi:hypothetical protein